MCWYAAISAGELVLMSEALKGLLMLWKSKGFSHCRDCTAIVEGRMQLMVELCQRVLYGF